MDNGAHDLMLFGKISTSPNAGLRCITDKGGCQNVVYGDIEITAPGTSEDVKLGDWSDQNYAYTPCRDLRKIVRKDGKRVRVVVGHAKWPIITNGQKIMWLRSFEAKAYWWSCPENPGRNTRPDLAAIIYARRTKIIHHAQ